MKKSVLISTLLASSALVTAAIAATPEELIANLMSQGYANVEAETEGTTIEVEGEKDGMEWEFVYDAETGEELSSESEPLDADDDEDDEDDENDDDDNDESDDDDGDEDDNDNGNDG